MKKSIMTKLFAAALTASILLSGCGSSNSSSASTDAAKTTEAAAETETDAAQAESSAEKVTIVAATSGSPAPHMYVNDDGTVTGYDAEVLKAAFERLPQYDLEIQVTALDSVFTGLSSGNYQVAFNNLSYNDERAASYLFSYPYKKITYVFVTRDGEDAITTFDEIAGKTTEVRSGTSYATAVETWNEENPDKAVNIQYTDAEDQILFQHLQDGAIDFIITSDIMYYAYEAEFELGDTSVIEVPEEEVEKIAKSTYAYYLLPMDAADLREELDAVLKEMQADGTLTKLSEEYLGTDLAPEASQYETTLN